MLIFSGLDRNGNVIIFDYILDTIDAEINPMYEFSYTYNVPSEAIIEGYDELDLSITYIDGESMKQIIEASGSETDKLVISLLWNAEEDLDLAFTCEDDVRIDWSNSKGENECGAVYDVE